MPELLSYKEACNRVAMGMAKSFRFYAEGKGSYPMIVQHHSGHFINVQHNYEDIVESWSCELTGCECMQRKTWILMKVPDE